MSSQCVVIHLGTIEYRAAWEKQKEAVRVWVAPSDGGVLLERVDQLSDQEMAERLGLDEDTVRKIRCMAEFDVEPEVWRNAAEFKRMSRLERPLGGTDRTVKSEPS